MKVFTSRLVSPAPYLPSSVSMGMNRFHSPAPFASATAQHRMYRQLREGSRDVEWSEVEWSVNIYLRIHPSV